MSCRSTQCSAGKPEEMIRYLCDAQPYATDLGMRRWATETLAQTEEYIAERQKAEAESQKQHAEYQKQLAEYE